MINTDFVSGAEQALTLQPTVYEEVDPFADYENRTSIINGPDRRFHDTGYEGMSPDNIYDATPSPSISLAGSIEVHPTLSKSSMNLYH